MDAVEHETEADRRPGGVELCEGEDLGSVCQETGRRRATVHFYGPRACAKNKRCPWCNIRFWLWSCWVGEVIHCDVQVDEFIYECTPKHGCQIRFAHRRIQKPLKSIPVWVDELDVEWWILCYGFTFWETVLHWSRLRRSDAGISNCVQATRHLLGEERKARTAQQLYFVLLSRSLNHVSDLWDQ